MVFLPQFTHRSYIRFSLEYCLPIDIPVTHFLSTMNRVTATQFVRIPCDSLGSMAVLSSRAHERRSREKNKLLPPQSPRSFSALARLYYLARPTKTAMLRGLPCDNSCQSRTSLMSIYLQLVVIYDGK